MLKFYAEDFFRMLTSLTDIKARISTDKELSVKPIPENGRKSLTTAYKEIIDLCKETELRLSLIQIERMLNSLEKPAYTHKDFVSDYEVLEIRIMDELSAPLFMVIPQIKVEFFDKPNLFGDIVFNSFPSANFDIEESGKCLATGRYTACVMHLQRIMEVGLRSYGLYLGVILNNPSWGNILTKTQTEINSRNSASSWLTTDEKEFCENLQPLLHSIRVAWRNPSMHAGAKYTEDEAIEIFNSVKGFMRNLADHLNEKGKFTKKKRK